MIVPRGSGKSKTIQAWNDYKESIPKVTKMIASFKASKVPTECILLKDGMPIPITIPPKTNLVHFLRHMFNEHKSGKLFVPSEFNKWDKVYKMSDWSLIMWGGGRQKASKIKAVSVKKEDLPQVIKLLELVE